MSNPFNKKLAELMGKVDEKVMQAKLNAAIDMIKKGNTDDLVKKLNKVDKDELMTKMNEFDDTRLKELNIDKEDVKKKIEGIDLDKIAALIGDKGDEIVNKIKDILK